MKLIILIQTLFILLICNTVLHANEIMQLYAGPGIWGPEKEICACLGNNITTRFSEVESNTDGTNLYMAWTSDNQEWNEVLPGQTLLRGQVVKLKVKSLGTGGHVKILVTGCCFISGNFNILPKPTAKQVFMYVDIIRQHTDIDQTEANNTLQKWMDGELEYSEDIQEFVKTYNVNEDQFYIMDSTDECIACIAGCCNFFGCNPVCVAGCVAGVYK